MLKYVKQVFNYIVFYKDLSSKNANSLVESKSNKSMLGGGYFRRRYKKIVDT